MQGSIRRQVGYRGRAAYSSQAVSGRSVGNTGQLESSIWNHEDSRERGRNRVSIVCKLEMAVSVQIQRWAIKSKCIKTGLRVRTTF